MSQKSTYPSHGGGLPEGGDPTFARKSVSAGDPRSTDECNLEDLRTHPETFNAYIKYQLIKEVRRFGRSK